MKKYVVILLLMCLLLCSCSDFSGITENTDDIKDTNGESVTCFSQIQGTIPPQYKYPLDYNSVAELKDSISEENVAELYANYLEYEAPQEIVDNLKYFIGKLQSQNVIVPCQNGEIVEFRNEEGFNNIALFAVELYDLPWLWYWPKVSTGENYYIQITYLPENIIRSNISMTASDLIKRLSPNSPNVDNVGISYKDIYNKSLKLGDCEVTALVYESKSDSRNITVFIYNDLLVLVRGNPQVWDEKWFSALTFERFEG